MSQNIEVVIPGSASWYTFQVLHGENDMEPFFRLEINMYILINNLYHLAIAFSTHR